MWNKQRKAVSASGTMCSRQQLSSHLPAETCFYEPRGHKEHIQSSLTAEEIPITSSCNTDTLKYLSLYFNLEMKSIEFIQVHYLAHFLPVIYSI